jgi:CRISPR-associated protein Cas1
VTTQGAWLGREGETIAVRVEQETRIRVPIHSLANVVCFGQVSCSSFAMNLCATSGVGLAFLTENGRFLARVQGPVSGNVLLRRRQYKWSDDPDSARTVTQAIVTAKVANCRTVLLRAAREKPGTPAAVELDRAALRLASLGTDLPCTLFSPAT